MVYLGIQESLNREVAIKILEPKLLKNDVIAKRFRREAKAAAHLSHSNIIQIIDVGKFHNHHYIIMEYLEESLKDRMKANPGGKIEPQIAVEIVQAILGALEFAHSRKIYHRDIKPDNIMFRADNTPVLVDFGVARILGFTDVGELTKSGQSMGTVYYMSPEQCQAQIDVDGRSDIYSLGAVLFEMLTGEKPYEGDSMVSVAVKHVQEPVPKLPRELRRYQPLIDKMMAKDRKKRLSREKQFQQLLDKIMTVTVKHTRQPKEFKSTTNGKTPTILILKKIGGSLKQILGKGLNSMNNLKGKLSSFKKKKLLPFIKKVVKLLFSSVNKQLSSFMKYPIKKKLVFGVLPVVLVVLIFIVILSRGPVSIKNQDFSYTSIYKLFKEDLPYHLGLNIVHELYKKGDLESLKGAHYIVNKLKEIKISTEINELEEKITNRIESDKKFDKYLVSARNYFKRKNFSKARENILLAKKIKTTPELITFEEEVKKGEAEGEKKLRQKDDQAYKLASSHNTIAAYQKYLDEFPSGRHSKEVTRKLNKLEDAERKKRTVTLRSQYKDDLNEKAVQSMIKKYGFFHTNWNNTGAFKSYYEKEVKNGVDVVIDYTTGLIWYNGELKVEMSLKEAEEWIEKLNSDKYGGYGDWRLPTLEEAVSLLRKDKNKQELHIDPIFSGNTSKIWTTDQTPRKLLGIMGKRKFWLVCFDAGNMEVSSKGDKYYVRPLCSLKR